MTHIMFILVLEVQILHFEFGIHCHKLWFVFLMDRYSVRHFSDKDLYLSTYKASILTSLWRFNWLVLIDFSFGVFLFLCPQLTIEIRVVFLHFINDCSWSFSWLREGVFHTFDQFLKVNQLLMSFGQFFQKLILLDVKTFEHCSSSCSLMRCHISKLFFLTSRSSFIEFRMFIFDWTVY